MAFFVFPLLYFLSHNIDFKRNKADENVLFVLNSEGAWVVNTRII